MLRRLAKNVKSVRKPKKKTIKYGKLAAKEAEAEPWETLCVDLIGRQTTLYGTMGGTIWNHES